jgi:hypothetical protein
VTAKTKDAVTSAAQLRNPILTSQPEQGVGTENRVALCDLLVFMDKLSGLENSFGR